jgi:hypothetical protein
MQPFRWHVRVIYNMLVPLSDYNSTVSSLDFDFILFDSQIEFDSIRAHSITLVAISRQLMV